MFTPSKRLTASRSGATPLDYARENRHDEVVKLLEASTHCLGNRWQGLGSRNAQCHAVPWSSIILIHYHSLSFIIHNYCSHRSLWLQGWKLKMLGLAQKLFCSTVRPHEFHCFGSSAACDWLIGLVCTKCEGSSCLATLIEFREQTRDWQLSCFRNSCKCRMLKVIPKISTPFVITFCLLGVNAAETCWNLFKSLARGKKQSDQIECTHIISHHCWKTTAWFPCKFVSGFKAV